MIIFLLLTSVAAHAALNKWIDAEGKVHYSDTPPTDAKAKTLRSFTSAEDNTPASEVSAPKSLAEKDVEWKKSQKAKEEAAQKAAVEQENATIKLKNCEIARTNLTVLENSSSIPTYDEKGERIMMDDSSRRKRTEEARKSVSSYCS